MNTDQILAQLGPCVLLAIPLGKKGPNTKEWQKLTLTPITPEYVASFNGSKNIRVSPNRPRRRRPEFPSSLLIGRSNYPC